MDEVLQFLKDNRPYYLATVDADGNPQLRPFGSAASFEGRLYFQTGNTKDVFKQIVGHPRVAICTKAPEGGWIRISADAVVDDRVEARQAILDAMPHLKDMYAADDGVCEVLYLDNATATFCSFTDEPRTVSF